MHILLTESKKSLVSMSFNLKPTDSFWQSSKIIKSSEAVSISDMAQPCLPLISNKREASETQVRLKKEKPEERGGTGVQEISRNFRFSN